MKVVGDHNRYDDRDYCEDDDGEDEADPSFFTGSTS